MNGFESFSAAYIYLFSSLFDKV
jgi:hypothetical protein